jgi:hypothetical protein
VGSAFSMNTLPKLSPPLYSIVQLTSFDTASVVAPKNPTPYQSPRDGAAPFAARHSPFAIRPDAQ